MIAKSTRQKRRNQARFPNLVLRRDSLRLRLIDPRCDFWLISSPAARWVHHEVYGRKAALQRFRCLVSGAGYQLAFTARYHIYKD